LSARKAFAPIPDRSHRQEQPSLAPGRSASAAVCSRGSLRRPVERLGTRLPERARETALPMRTGSGDDGDSVVRFSWSASLCATNPESLCSRAGSTRKERHRGSRHRAYVTTGIVLSNGFGPPARQLFFAFRPALVRKSLYPAMIVLVLVSPDRRRAYPTVLVADEDPARMMAKRFTSGPARAATERTGAETPRHPAQRPAANFARCRRIGRGDRRAVEAHDREGRGRLRPVGRDAGHGDVLSRAQVDSCSVTCAISAATRAGPGAS